MKFIEGSQTQFLLLSSAVCLRQLRDEKVFILWVHLEKQILKLEWQNGNGFPLTDTGYSVQLFLLVSQMCSLTVWVLFCVPRPVLPYELRGGKRSKKPIALDLRKLTIYWEEGIEISRLGLISVSQLKKFSSSCTVGADVLCHYRFPLEDKLFSPSYQSSMLFV